MPSASPTGGAEEAFLQLLRSQAGRTIDWQVLFLEQGPLLAVASELGADVDYIPCGRTRQVLKWWKAAGTIGRKALKFDAKLLLGWMTKGHVYAGLASLRSGIPCDWFQMGFPEGGLLDRMSGWLPKRHVYTCSEYVAQLQRRATPSAQVIPVPLGVDLNRFQLSNLADVITCRKKLGLPTDREIVGIVGRLQRWKGMHVLIHAMAAVVEEYPRAICLIVGGSFSAEPGYQEKLTSLVERLGLARSVQFVGAQPNVPEWIQAMDVFVHASEKEPFGIVVIEALALGKPVIACVPGGPDEIFARDAVGALVRFGDVDALAKAITRVLETERQVIQKNISVANSYSAEAFAEKLVQQMRSRDK